MKFLAKVFWGAGGVLVAGLLGWTVMRAVGADKGQLFYDGYEMLKAGRAQEAAAKFEQGLKSDPKNATALYYLGEAYSQLGKKQQAQERYQASLTADPKSAVAGQALQRLDELMAGGKKENVDPAKYPAAGSLIKDCDVCPELVVIPAGAFVMGSPPSEAGRDADEGPAHKVTLARPFALGKYEVTWDEWDACVRAGYCAQSKDEGWGRGRRPVIHVDWEQAQGFTEWLAEKTGKQYRLPSEAEWEYAARAGSEKARHWGAAPDRACRFANVYDQSGEGKRHWQRYGSMYVDGTAIFAFACKDGQADTAPVGSYPPNDFGLHDMLGNVWEWTEDCYNESYSGAPSDGSAWGAGDCGRRVNRGGSWADSPPRVRSAARDGDAVSNRLSSLGFRVARTLP